MIDGVAKATHQGNKEFEYKTKDSDFRDGNGTGILIENFSRHKFANSELVKGLQVNLDIMFYIVLTSLISYVFHQ